MLHVYYGRESDRLGHRLLLPRQGECWSPSHQDTTRHDRIGHDMTRQDRTELDRGRIESEWRLTAQTTIALEGLSVTPYTLGVSRTQHNTIQHNSALHNTARHNTAHMEGDYIRQRRQDGTGRRTDTQHTIDMDRTLCPPSLSLSSLLPPSLFLPLHLSQRWPRLVVQDISDIIHCQKDR